MTVRTSTSSSARWGGAASIVEHAADVIGEISDHLAQSGDRPRDAFGDPESFAAAFAAADDGAAHDGDGRYETRTFRATALDEMQREGWTPCGRWLTFHYFKRMTPATGA